ncbi:hypothetical protein ACFL7D_03675 [candidate division KSB1 bacterium]
MQKHFKKLIYLILIGLIFSYNVSDCSAQYEEKSAKKAFFYSLLLPGLGQHYVEDKLGAKIFAGTELAMIGLAIGHEKYSGWLKEDYETFAAEHAGIDPYGKEKDYFVEISQYRNIYMYNEKMRKERLFDKVIPELPGYIWVWDSKANQDQYHVKRIKADKIKNRTILFYSGILANHIISGIHAVIKARRYKPQTNENSWDISYYSNQNPYNPAYFVKFSIKF